MNVKLSLCIAYLPDKLHRPTKVSFYLRLRCAESFSFVTSWYEKHRSSM